MANKNKGTFVQDDLLRQSHEKYLREGQCEEPWGKMNKLSQKWPLALEFTQSPPLTSTMELKTIEYGTSKKSFAQYIGETKYPKTNCKRPP